MIRAAALSYAIVFSLLIGLICSGVLFIAASQKKIEVIHNNRERVLFDSYAAIQFGMRAIKLNDSSVLYHANGDTSFILHKQWGAFNLVASETHKGNYSRLRSALTGFLQSPELPALYLPGNSSGLKVGGDTKITGDVFVPNAEVERAYVGGRNYTNEKLVYGEIRAAEITLPGLKEQWLNLTAQSFKANAIVRDYRSADSTYSFHQPTTFYETINPVYIAENISGNVIIHSFDSIYISAEAHLDNIILVAPVVRFQQGFTGTVQVVAHETITCEKKVHLLYPSVLILNELEQKKELSKRAVLLDEESMVLGGILITSQSYDFRKPPFLEIRSNASVAGLIYNSGETELLGKVFGSLYTQQLLTRIGGGTYGNHLFDAGISAELPADFLFPGWLKEQNILKPKVIDWL